MANVTDEVAVARAELSPPAFVAGYCWGVSFCVTTARTLVASTVSLTSYTLATQAHTGGAIMRMGESVHSCYEFAGEIQ